MAGPSGGTVKTAKVAPKFRIERVEQRDHRLKLLVYGPYGVGKTTLACSALAVPFMRNALLINAESGDLSVEHMNGLDTIPVTTFKNLAYVVDFLRAYCTARDEGNKAKMLEFECALRGEEVKEPTIWQTVIVDSLSEVEARCLEALQGINDTTRMDDEPDKLEWDHYSKNNTMIQRLVRALRDLPMHVIFTCGQKFIQDETKRRLYTLDLRGQSATKVQGFMDMVGYYVQGREGEVTRRVLHVVPDPRGRYDAKHRYAQFKKDFFVDPTMENILKQTGLWRD